MNTSLRDLLAEHSHNAWAQWMKYLFSRQGRNPTGEYGMLWGDQERWQRRMSTPYADLPPEEQQSDLAEADTILAIVSTELSALQARSDEADEVIIHRINEMMKCKAERDKLQAQLAECEEDRIRHLRERNDAWDREKALQSRIDAMLTEIDDTFGSLWQNSDNPTEIRIRHILKNIRDAGVEK